MLRWKWHGRRDSGSFQQLRDHTWICRLRTLDLISSDVALPRVRRSVTTKVCVGWKDEGTIHGLEDQEEGGGGAGSL